MGTTMALNLARYFPLTVWYRSTANHSLLQTAGATVVDSPAKVIEQSYYIFTMLFDGPACQAVINPSNTALTKALRGKTLINTRSVPVEVSCSLAQVVHAAGGSFIEMRVGGSRVPAEQGRLVAMMAGDKHVCDLARPVIASLTTAAVYCGPIGAGLRTKYAGNSYLIALTTGLAESMSLAQAKGLDLTALGDVLNAGPMASVYTRYKIDKMSREDLAAQASVKDCWNSTRLIAQAVEEVGIQAPVISLCSKLYGRALEEGLGGEDMVALTKVFGEQSKSSCGANGQQSS